MLQVVIKSLPPDLTSDFEDFDQRVLNHLEQDYKTQCETIPEAIDKTNEYIDKLQELLECLHSTEDEWLFVPDTDQRQLEFPANDHQNSRSRNGKII